MSSVAAKVAVRIDTCRRPSATLVNVYRHRECRVLQRQLSLQMLPHSSRVVQDSGANYVSTVVEKKLIAISVIPRLIGHFGKWEIGLPWLLTVLSSVCLTNYWAQLFVNSFYVFEIFFDLCFILMFYYLIILFPICMFNTINLSARLSMSCTRRYKNACWLIDQ